MVAILCMVLGIIDLRLFQHVAEMDNPFSIIAFIYTWQTLISGVLALTAAMGTIHVMNLQRRDEWVKHNDRIYRSSLSARAKMPDAIDDISLYFKACFEFIKEGLSDFPKQPEKSINVLKESIQFLDNNSAEMIYELIVFYQIYNARLKSHSESRGTVDKDDIYFDTIKINSMNLNIFDFARNREKVISKRKLNRDDLKRSIIDLIGFMNWNLNPANKDFEKHLECIVEIRCPS